MTLPATELHTLPSRHVEGVTYKLYVSLPRDYATRGRSYPVVYLLDADYSFAIAHNVVEHLSARTPSTTRTTTRCSPPPCRAG